MKERPRFKQDDDLRIEGLAGAEGGWSVNLRCPHCGCLGVFEPPVRSISDIAFHRKAYEIDSDGDDVEVDVRQRIGIRVCPSYECRGVVAVAYHLGDFSFGGLLWCAPSELIDFDPKDIPREITESMREAVASHSVKSYRASALMVRRNLELLCQEKGVDGKNLKERIEALSRHVIVLPGLLAAADHLRILGNDAAHLEAKDYSEIDEEHARIAIDVAKEILKAVYQHDDLVARLTRLKAAPKTAEGATAKVGRPIC